jgi:hypothetical protein
MYFNDGNEYDDVYELLDFIIKLYGNIDIKKIQQILKLVNEIIIVYYTIRINHVNPTKRNMPRSAKYKPCKDWEIKVT